MVKVVDKKTTVLVKNTGHDVKIAEIENRILNLTKLDKTKYH